MTDLDRMLHDLAEHGSRAAGQADPTEIRRAGDARRRRRVFGALAATILAVLLAAATAVGVSTARQAPVQVSPADPPQGQASPSPHHRLADDPLLPGPIGWSGAYDGLKRTEGKAEFLQSCLPSPSDLGADEVEAAGYFGDSEATVNLAALEFATSEDAIAGVAEVIELRDSCYREPYDRDTTVHEPRERSAGDEAWVFALESIPNENNAGSGTSYSGYGIVRTANVVVLAEFSAMGMPVEEKPYGTWSADRLQELVTTAIG